MIRKREITVLKSESGKSLLDFLTKRYTYHTRDRWREHIIAKRVLINNSESQEDYKLKEGDIITYIPEPVIEPPINGNYKTIYEDEDLLIINKPSDLPCHPGGIYFQNTLWYILKQKYSYISLINRLDRETSGIMLIAKSKESAKFYFNKMMQRDIKKDYLVLVHGNFPKKLSAKGWLGPDPKSVIRKKRSFILDSEAKQPEGEGDPKRQFSHSEFQCLKSENSISLVRCNILTGRTHQIRASLLSLGYPVVGDKIYGLDDSFFFKFINDELTEKEIKELRLNNQALHSYITELPMLNGDRAEFKADPPDSWFIKLQ